MGPALGPVGTGHGEPWPTLGRGRRWGPVAIPRAPSLPSVRLHRWLIPLLEGLDSLQAASCAGFCPLGSGFPSPLPFGPRGGDHVSATGPE